VKTPLTVATALRATEEPEGTAARGTWNEPRPLEEPMTFPLASLTWTVAADGRSVAEVATWTVACVKEAPVEETKVPSLQLPE
jgi:hypothetical protein